MPEMHLDHPEFAYDTCGSINQNNGRIQKPKETGD